MPRSPYLWKIVLRILGSEPQGLIEQQSWCGEVSKHLMEVHEDGEHPRGSTQLEAGTHELST